MIQDKAQHNAEIDSENLLNDLRIFTEEIDNDIIALLRCDEILGDEPEDEFDEDSSEEEMVYEMTCPDSGYCATDLVFTECFCDAGILWNEDSIWSFRQGSLEDRMQEPGNGETEVGGSSCAVLFWGW